VEPGSRIGVVGSGGSVRIGYCALTNTVAARADRTAAKPVPGRFWAALSATAGTVDRSEDDVLFESVHLDSGSPSRSTVTHDLHVKCSGRYVLSLTGAFIENDLLVISIDGEERSRIRVHRANHVVATEVDLTTPEQTLSVRAINGRPVLTLVTMRGATPAPTTSTAGGEQSGYGKSILAPETYDDVTLSATLRIRLNSADSHGDILFRATQLSEGGEGDDTRLGIDFLLGYSVQLHRDRIVLARHDYDEQMLATVPSAIDDTIPHVVVVQAYGSTLTVDLDGARVIEYDEPLPHLFGQIGIRTSNADLRIESLHIATESTT
jgi:hypothetical protein